MNPHTLHMEGCSFSDLFTDRRAWNSETDGHPNDVEPDTGIGHYMAVSGGPAYRSFWVRPTPRLVDFITRHMFLLDDDRKYFEVVERVDGTALILAKYNQILGSRWLTIVPTDSLPWSINPPNEPRRMADVKEIS